MNGITFTKYIKVFFSSSFLFIIIAEKKENNLGYKGWLSLLSFCKYLKWSKRIYLGWKKNIYLFLSNQIETAFWKWKKKERNIVQSFNKKNASFNGVFSFFLLCQTVINAISHIFFPVLIHIFTFNRRVCRWTSAKNFIKSRLNNLG